MCGIVYKTSFNNKPVNQAIAQMYNKQKHRGINGFGFYLPQLNRLTHNTKEGRILNLLGRKEYQATEVLFHHRYPTSTANKQNACHPFSTKANKALFDHNYVLVHNGVLHNERDLKLEHEKLGINYVSVQPDGGFNDSEALLYDVALYLEGKQTELQARGSIAFIVKRDDGKTFFARNYGSPLQYELTSRGLTVRSEGNGEQVLANTLYEFLSEQKAFVTKPLEIQSGYTNSYTPQPSHAPDYTVDDMREARQLALSFGGVTAAIDFYDELLQESTDVIAELESRYSTDQSVGVLAAIEKEEDQIDQITGVTEALWTLWGEEPSETYGLEVNYG